MTDLIEKYQEKVMEHQTEAVDLSDSTNTSQINLSQQGGLTIRDSENRIIMEISENGDIHFYGNLIVHGDLTTDGDIRANRVFNAVFN